MALKYISKLKEKEGKMHGIIQIHNYFNPMVKNQSPLFLQTFILKFINSMDFFLKINYIRGKKNNIS